MPRVPPDPSQCVGLSASLGGCFLDWLVRRPAPEYRSGRLVRALPFVACLFAPMLGFGVTGCTVGPDYRSPEINAAPTRTSLETVDVLSRTVDGRIDAAWWKSFRHSQLSSLVERLAAQNLDLRTAAERVVQSVAQRRIAVSQGLPHIDGQSATTYNRQSPNGTLSLLTPAAGAPLDYGLFHDGLTSSWQLDLFGRVRRAVEAADANALAAVENRHGVAPTAVAELAQSYMPTARDTTTS
jgi:outer membrane protein TolC